MQSNASIITSVPLVLLLIMIYSISTLALRENMDGLDNSLKNINDIKELYTLPKYGNGPNGGHLSDYKNREYVSFNNLIL